MEEGVDRGESKDDGGDENPGIDLLSSFFTKWKWIDCKGPCMCLAKARHT